MNFKVLKKFLALAMALLMTGIACSCAFEKTEDGTKASDTEQSESKTEDKSEGATVDPYESKDGEYVKELKVVTDKELFIGGYDWRNKIFGTTEDGSGTRFWETPAFESAYINHINVFPRAWNDDLTSIIGEADGNRLLGDNPEKIMEQTAAGLKECHDKGIEVTASLPLVLIGNKDNKILEKYPELYDYLAIEADGTPCLNKNGGNYLALCFNNPNVYELHRNFVELAARAGYDGMFFDAEPYYEPYGAGLLCQCQSCKDDWKEFSVKYLGKEVPLPNTAADLTSESDVGRALFVFRAQIYFDHLMNLREEGRKYNPDFECYPNIKMDQCFTPYYITQGMTTLFSEMGADSGVESTLYMYALNRTRPDTQKLLAQYNDHASQVPYLFQYDVAFSEAAANGGTMTLRPNTTVVERDATATAVNGMMVNNEYAFTKTASAADTAILYSWHSMCYGSFKALKSNYQLQWSDNVARRMGAYLAAKGIPYDYIIPEDSQLEIEDLTVYKTIILPNVSYMTEAFEELLEEYVANGGNLIIAGQKVTGKYYVDANNITRHERTVSVLEELTGKAEITDGTYEYGNGKVVVVKNFENNAGYEYDSRPTANLTTAFEDLNMYQQLRVYRDAGISGKIESTIFSDSTGKNLYVHLIHYGVYKDTAGTATVDKQPNGISTAYIGIPNGQKVKDVTVISPFRTEEELDIVWRIKNNKVCVSGNFGRYVMIQVTFQ